MNASKVSAHPTIPFDGQDLEFQIMKSLGAELLWLVAVN